MRVHVAWWLRVSAALALVATAGVLFGNGRAPRPAFAGLSVLRDIPYRTAVDERGAATMLHLDVFEPGRGGDRPAIVWLHGGGFTGGDKIEMDDLARNAAQHDYVGVTVEYRLRPDMRWQNRTQRAAAARDAYDDAAGAVTFLRGHAKEYGVDAALIFVGGYSAGGIVAFDLAYPPRGATPAPIAGSIPIAGDAYGTPRPGAPPVLAFHGSVDGLIPYRAAVRTCRAAAAEGDHCELVTFRGANHEIGITKVDVIGDRVADFVASMPGQR